MESTTQVQPLRLGTRIEGFEVSRITDHDPGGYTYVGNETATKKPVVIREYPPSAAPDLAALAQARHANLATVLRTFELNGRAYLITEPIAGEALSDLLQRETSFDEARLKSVLLPLADGLEAAHVAGVLHLDIQPDHIVVRPNGSPVLVGFGVGGSEQGNPGYSAIEQYPGDLKVGRWTDIYALGAVGYRLLSGQAPPEADRRQARDEMKPAQEIGANRYSRSLLQAIDWALTVHPLERPQNLAQWKDALLGLRETIGAGGNVGATVPITATMIRKFSELREKKKEPSAPPPPPAKVDATPGPAAAPGVVEREFEKARQASDSAQREKAERERRDRDELERNVRERFELEQAKRAREAQEEAERERVAREKAEQEQREGSRERAEREAAEREKAEREKAERERVAREKSEREKAERERAEREKSERERAEREKAARERAEKEQREQARREAAERDKAEKEQRERARREAAEREKAERDRIEREKAERERTERERAERERAERERAERERAERERAERERAERERVAAARTEPAVQVPVVTVPPRVAQKPRPDPPSPPASGPSWISAVAAVLVLVLAIGYWWYNDSRQERRAPPPATAAIPADAERVVPAMPTAPAGKALSPAEPAAKSPPPEDREPETVAKVETAAPAPEPERAAEPEAPKAEPPPPPPKPKAASKPAARPRALEAPADASGQKQLVTRLRKKLNGTWTQESTYTAVVPGDGCYAKISRSWSINFGGTAEEGRSLTGSFSTKVRAQSAERRECRQFDDQVRVEGALTARPVSGNTLQVEAVPTRCAGDCDEIADVFNYRTLERRYRFNVSADGYLSFSEGDVDFELTQKR